MSFLVCLPAIGNFNKPRCLPIWLFYLFFALSLSISYEIPQITQVLPLSFSLSRSLSLKNKHRLTGNVGYGRNRRHKKRKPEMERVASGTDNSFVVAIVGNLWVKESRMWVYVCVCWKKKNDSKPPKNSLKTQVKP